MFACCDVKLYFSQVIIHYANIAELENTSICQQQQNIWIIYIEQFIETLFK